MKILSLLNTIKISDRSYFGIVFEGFLKREEELSFYRE